MVPVQAFSEPTRNWFAASFPAPTAAQTGAWEAISNGRHTLVVAPTGSGKTLSAFLWSIDRLLRAPLPDKHQRCRVLYISPLKALGVDVERNLRAPLSGIGHAAGRLGVDVPPLRVGVRSGDTSAADRRTLQSNPPDILITTPESLFLMLTSRAREMLAGVETVIIDEIHAVAASKRGAHLGISLERLDALLPRPAQRIGLSATVRPVEEVARFLGGGMPVDIVAPPAHKSWDLQVVVPVADMSSPDNEQQSVWPHVEAEVARRIGEHRTTIVFANSRRLAERLTARLNEIASGADADEAGGPPAQVMAQSGATSGAPQILARAHHGSVSKDQRAQIEDDLKAGRIPAVVATSSLELGIDMGAVDQVIQIESPPSVASALQRVGRAGHQVGETSRGVLFPKHLGDLAPTAVAVQRMRTGQIEALRLPTNPLDVLAQQVVAAVAMDTWDVEDLFALARRAACFATLPRSAFDATLDLLAGRYPSDEFAELRPRVVWDRVAGTLAGRPGAQRLAVTSGGTIPDRGMFGVFLAGEGVGRRVGELDEEMVYESRVGDVFALGATSWRIQDITHDRVIVVPAPGVPGRLPFWKGDSIGRPAEFGEAVGSFTRELAGLRATRAVARATECGLDVWAAENLVRYVHEQAEATRVLPSDTTLVLERFRDELGDWRLVLHSPYGMGVHSAWALAINARLRERHGMDGQAMAADSGIVIRVPDTDDTPPGADLVVFDPDEIEALVTAEVGGSALFASRFRECAARALLLPRRHPGRRSPLWQQRQRSAALLTVAAQFPTFPIILEAVRECLQDVYDLPALGALLTRIEGREVAVTDVETSQPSPYARTLLFGYVENFIYEGDAPLAERKAAALTLDQTMLAELLGRAELRDLLDPEVIAEVEAGLQRLTAQRQARDAEAMVDLIRTVGPLSTTEVTERCTQDPTEWLTAMAAARRVVEVRVAGEQRWAVVEDVGRLRDGLGVPVPVGGPSQFTAPVEDPVGDLVGRHARTHGPFTAAEVADRLGLGVAVVTHTLTRLGHRGRVVDGEFRPGAAGVEWCDAEVLRTVRRRSLARLRDQIEPVTGETVGRFLPAWHGIGTRRQRRGVDGLATVVDQLAGFPVPASALESLVLPALVVDYQPAMLDELCSSGEVLWAGHGPLSGSDGWVSLHRADGAGLSLPSPDAALSATASEVLGLLRPGGAWFFRELRDRVDRVKDDELTAALWELVWAGQVSNDTLAPLRELLRSGSTTHKSRSTAPRGRLGSRTGPLGSGGRWGVLPSVTPDATPRAQAMGERLLARHGVVTRGAVAVEGVPGGFSSAYRVLSTFEDSGRCRRGYFIDRLGAAQFGTAASVDRLRSFADSEDQSAVCLAATDPANPYGAALSWPESTGHRPGRKSGSLVVLVGGALVLYVERGGRTALSWSEDAGVLAAACGCLVDTVRAGRLGSLTIQKADGESLLGSQSALRAALEEAGFVPNSRGLQVR
ncbi:MAG: ATP-dependent helicase [Nocardioides sp.]